LLLLRLLLRLLLPAVACCSGPAFFL